MMTVWSHEEDGVRVVTYTNLTEEMRSELKKDSKIKTYLNNMGDSVSLDIAYDENGEETQPDGAKVKKYKVKAYTTWKADKEQKAALREQERLAEEAAAKQAAYDAAVDALDRAITNNTIHIDPETLRVHLS